MYHQENRSSSLLVVMSMETKRYQLYNLLLQRTYFLYFADICMGMG